MQPLPTSLGCGHPRSTVNSGLPKGFHCELWLQRALPCKPWLQRALLLCFPSTSVSLVTSPSRPQCEATNHVLRETCNSRDLMSFSELLQPFKLTSPKVCKSFIPALLVIKIITLMLSHHLDPQCELTDRNCFEKHYVEEACSYFVDKIIL